MMQILPARDRAAVARLLEIAVDDGERLSAATLPPAVSLPP